MIIVDTSVWIEFLKGDQETKSLMIPYLKKNHIIAISAVFGELLQGVRNKRERSLIMSFWQHLPKIDEKELFIKAGQISNEQKLYTKGVGLMDCYLLAAALDKEYALWTKDKKLLQAVDMLSE